MSLLGTQAWSRLRPHLWEDGGRERRRRVRQFELWRQSFKPSEGKLESWRKHHLTSARKKFVLVLQCYLDCATAM